MSVACIDRDSGSDEKEPPPLHTINTAYSGNWNNFTDQQIEYIAKNNKIVVSSSGPNQIARIRAHNPDLELFFYFNLVGTHNPLPDVPLWLDDSGQAIQHEFYGWNTVDFRNPA